MARAQPNRAIAELKQLLAAVPGDEDALAELAELQMIKEQWSDAAATLAALVERTDDADQRHRALLHQAELLLHRLQDPQRARGVLDRVLEGQPADVNAKQLLVELAVTDGDWEEARRLLEGMRRRRTPEVQVWALGKLADVADIGLRGQDLRRTYEISALTEAAPQRPVLDRIVEGYWLRQQCRLLHLGEEIIGATTRADVDRAAALLVARLLLEERVDPGHALQLLRESLIARPDDQEVQLLFAQALEATGDDSSAIGGYRRILEGAAGSVPRTRGWRGSSAGRGRWSSPLRRRRCSSCSAPQTPTHRFRRAPSRRRRLRRGSWPCGSSRFRPRCV